MTKPLALLLLLSLLSGSPSRADDTAFLQGRINAAIHSHQSRLTLPPGTYHVAPPSGSGTCLEFQDARDLTVTADRVHLVATKRARLLNFDRCVHLTLQGNSLTLDMNPLAYTQGVVSAISPDGKTLTLRLDPGYPEAQSFDRIDFWTNDKNHYRLPYMPFEWGTKVTDLGSRVMQAVIPNPFPQLQTGTLVTLGGHPDPGMLPHSVGVNDCAGCHFSGLIVYASNSMGIVEAGGDGGNAYANVCIEPGPPLTPGGPARLLSCPADGFNFGNEKRGPTMRRCRVISTSDDAFSIQNDDYGVVAVSGNRLVMIHEDYRSWILPGDHLQAGFDTPAVTVDKTESMSLQRAGITQAALDDFNRAAGQQRKLSDDAVVVTLSVPSSYLVNAWLYDADKQCRGFVFDHNYEHAVGRGALVKGGGWEQNNAWTDAQITDNIVEGAVFGVAVDPESHVGGIAHLQIRGNTFTACGAALLNTWSPAAAVVCLNGGNLDAKTLFRDITISGNVFQDSYELPIEVTQAQRVQISGNIFRQIGDHPPNGRGMNGKIDQSALVWISLSDGVQLSDNRASDIGPGVKTFTEANVTVTNITGLNEGVWTRKD